MGGLEAFLRPLVIPDDTLCALAVAFSRTYQDLARTSSDQFLATPVNVLPHGKERGKFLAIDVGGSNLRVGFVDLLGDSRDPRTNIQRYCEKSWAIEEHLKSDQADQLFTWIGDCISDVLRAYLSDGANTLDEEIPMGMCFSFPLMQRAIHEATLMPMGKGFAITSNTDLAKMLLAGYQRHVGQPVNNGSNSKNFPALKIVAITNDTVATMASLAYSAGTTPNRRVAMGLIVGTGTNATIPMQLKELHESKRTGITLPAASSDDDRTIVNTEWSIKGAAAPLHDLKVFTRWDAELDRHCDAPGFQPFEYMTSGRYLGELVRLVVYDWYVNVERSKPEDLPLKITMGRKLSTPWLSKVVATTTSPDSLIAILSQHMPAPEGSPWSWTHEHAYVLKKTTEVVVMRSCKLIAAATVGLMGCVGELTLDDSGDEEMDDGELKQGKTLSGVPPEETEDLIVACTGGLIFQYPGFFINCQNNIDDLVGELNIKNGVRRVKLQESADGGIIGAGVLAGTVWQLNRNH